MVEWFDKYMKEQLRIQYQDEVISDGKNEIDFSIFDSALNKYSESDFERLDRLIFERDIENIQNSIQDGDLTCEEVVLYYINRIKKYDSYYNSVMKINPKALEIARYQDERLKNNEKLGDLSGTVVLIKDNIAEQNMTTSAGAYALKDLTTKRDAFIIEKIKKEDAIILGKANLSEWANFMSDPSSNGFSVLGGQTKNAYGMFDAGGSSSGSAVAVAMNFSMIALGSETCGSIVYPSSQNDVVGLKPTVGLLSRDLIIPITEAQDTAGIMGKSVKDVAKVFRYAIGYDNKDSLGMNAANFDMEQFKRNLDKDYLVGKRIGIVPSEIVSSATKQLKNELISCGADVVEIEINHPKADRMSVYNYGMINDVAALLNNKDVNTKFKSLKEIINFNKENPHLHMPYGQALLEGALSSDLSEDEYKEIVEKNRELTSKEIDKTLEENDIIAIASFSNELSDLFAVATYPALTIPGAFRENNEPLGVTFVGTLNNDYKLIEIGYAYESYTNHRMVPMARE
ncbi:amidase family protein [Vallitalea okinawensis]|uniref:amidase family protein n=1 Tax=Vallitalea okinawensis TaxID=2078660 RepID=UPI000CFDD313|nr:amidase family protein [Vallitalea okinawensis]